MTWTQGYIFVNTDIFSSSKANRGNCFGKVFLHWLVTDHINVTVDSKCVSQMNLSIVQTVVTQNNI